MSETAEGCQDIESLLKKFDIESEDASKYADALKREGIKSTGDLKYVDDFQQLLPYVKDITFGDRKKFEKAWKSIHPVNIFII